jgi:hypothetical protein
MPENYFFDYALRVEPKRNLSGAGQPKAGPLALPSVFRYFPPAVAKVYIVSFRTHDDRRPSKFIVLASRFDKSTAQAQEIKEGALRVL